MRGWLGWMLVLLVALAGGCAAPLESGETAATPAGRELPNIVLTTHENTSVHFYDDLVKDKVVLINFMFTDCHQYCLPTTRNLTQVQTLLGDRVGRDIFLLSISLDPAHDTPAVLQAYAAQHGVKPGWLFLTGKADEIERLRRKLGVTDPDPVIDADKAQHAALLTVGNARLGRWTALPALLTPTQIVASVLRVAQ